MPVISNYIDVSERTFLETATFNATSSTLWTSDGTLAVDASSFQDAEFGSLKLTPSALENYVKFNFWSTPVSDIPSQFAFTKTIDVNDYLESFMWVKPSVNCTLYLKTVLTEVEYDSVSDEYQFTGASPDTVTGSEGVHEISLGSTDSEYWHLVRSKPIQIPSNGTYSISLQFRVVFQTLTNAYLNISRPTTYAALKIFRNGFLGFASRTIPEIFLESDTANLTLNKPIFPLTKFLDVITAGSDNIFDKVLEFDYSDISEGKDENNSLTLSGLVNAEVADSTYLFWLAQFRGRPVLITYQPSTEGVGWEVFTLDSSLLNGGDVLGTDAINSGTLPDGVEAYARWQVKTGYYGHNAGTVQSMIDAAKRALTGDKIVNYTVSQNQIALTTSQAETFGTVVGDIGTSNSFVLSLVEPARPLGMIVTHTLTA